MGVPARGSKGFQGVPRGFQVPAQVVAGHHVYVILPHLHAVKPPCGTGTGATHTVCCGSGWHHAEQLLLLQAHAFDAGEGVLAIGGYSAAEQLRAGSNIMRGWLVVLYPSLHQSLRRLISVQVPLIALLFASAHLADAFPAEALLGSILSGALLAADGNLLVPLLAHSLYTVHTVVHVFWVQSGCCNSSSVCECTPAILGCNIVWGLGCHHSCHLVT